MGMSYKSPIELIMSDMQIRMEGEVCKAVQNVGVNVDKEELLKVLRHDMNQYQKGYADRDSEIVRCKDCEYYKDETARDKHPSWLPCMSVQTTGNWFCADGVKRDE